MTTRVVPVCAALLIVGGLATGAALLPRQAETPQTAAALTASSTPSPIGSASPAAVPSASLAHRRSPAVASSVLPTRTAVEAVHAYTGATDALSGSTEPDLVVLQDVVAGDALKELEAQQLELKANGESVRGRARVASVRLLRQGTDSGSPTARIIACIDSSDVQVVDDDGKPVSSTTVGSQRALNLYDLRLEKGSWLIVRHTFPADTAC